jgi:hypothetical protein
MIKNTKNNIGGFFTITVVLLLALYFIFFFPPKKNPPLGIPMDYFDIINSIEEKHANVYIFSDDFDFNEDYTPIYITSIDQIPGGTSNPYNFLIIDMNKYKNDEFGTLDQINYLYRIRYFHILILNNKKSNSSLLNDLMDPRDIDSDLITLTFTPQHDVYYSGSDVGGFPNNQILMYSILFTIDNIIEENDG